MKIIAIFVAYKPDMNALRRNVAAVIDSVDYVLVWRNSGEDFSTLSAVGAPPVRF